MIRTVVLALVLVCVAVPVVQASDTSFSHEPVIPVPGELGDDVILHGSCADYSPPANPQVGDSWVWWLFLWDPMPPHFEQVVCTVRGKTDRGYVVVRDEDWGVSISQSDVDSILYHWELSSPGPYPDKGIYEIDSLSFGNPPDELDNDPRIYLMWYDFGVSADGFFFYFDEYPEGTYPGYHSNECEVLYLNPTSTGGPSGDYMHAVMAHEFEHMIHWKYDEDETSWVDEGMAELAMWFYGHPDNISSFNTNPDNDLTDWQGDWSDYIQTYLWSLYFFQRYGGQPSVYALVHEPLNSMDGYDAVLDSCGYTENTQDMFLDWSVANFLDDTTIADGRYGYEELDLPAFSPAASFSSYPVSETRSVNHWAADYYRLQDIPFDSLSLNFDGNDGNSFGVRAMVLHETSPTEVAEMTLDGSTQTGQLGIGGLDPLDQVILMVASVSSSGGQDYTFSAGNALGIGTPSGQCPEPVMRAYPSPSTGVVTIRLQNPGLSSPTVNVYDIRGCLVARLQPMVDPDGAAVYRWDGKTGDGTHAAAGLYFAVASTATGPETAEVLLMP